MPASNATVSKLYGNRCGFSGGLNREALSRDCSMLIDINRVANRFIWSVSFIWIVWFL